MIIFFTINNNVKEEANIMCYEADVRIKKGKNAFS